MKHQVSLQLAGIFLFLLPGCTHTHTSASQDPYPKEDFSVIEIRNGNKPMIGSYNTAYKMYDEKATYPWCLTLSIDLDTENIYKNGLPKDEESTVVNELEDKLLTEIQKLTTAHYVGHIYTDASMEAYIYLDNPDKVQDYLQMQLNNPKAIRQIHYEMMQDPNWTTAQVFFHTSE